VRLRTKARIDQTAQSHKTLRRACSGMHGGKRGGSSCRRSPSTRATRIERLRIRESQGIEIAQHPS
jgi:hypothetical protein